jgi:ATP-binding cassette, subfamily B, multidrug efflux pump
MKKLLSYFKNYYFVIITSVILITIVALLVSYSPILESEIIAAIQKQLENPIAIDDFRIVLLRIVLTLVIVYITVATLRLIINFSLTTAIQKTMKKIRNDVQQKLHKMPVSYFDTKPIGNIMSIMSNDVESLGNGLQQAFASIINSVLSIIFVLFFMLTKLTWQFSLLALIMFVIIFSISRVILKFSGPLYSKRFRVFGTLSGHLQEQYNGFKEISLYNKQEDSALMFDDIMEDLSDAIFKSDFVSGLLNPLVSTVTYFTIAILVLVGGKMAFAGTIPLALLHAGIRYIWRLANPITSITQMSVIVQSSVAAGKRVFNFLDEKEESADPVETFSLDEVKGHIELKNVSFSYVADKPILKNISFEAKPGEMIAIVGPTGSGKTTIINLLMRFYEINEGEILLDGINIKDLKRNDLRTYFGMVLQDTWLFNGTIANNIKYGKDDATMEEIIDAATLANINHYVHTLPLGYDMEINEEANNISQGEKQLMTIARAFLADPSILILDEATSTVDTRLELMLQEAMRNIMKNRTSFVIAHRLSTIKNADKIIVLKDGEIIEIGNHETLMNNHGFYEQLYNSQFEE